MLRLEHNKQLFPNLGIWYLGIYLWDIAIWENAFGEKTVKHRKNSIQTYIIKKRNFIQFDIGKIQISWKTTFKKRTTTFWRLRGWWPSCFF